MDRPMDRYPTGSEDGLIGVLIGVPYKALPTRWTVQDQDRAGP